MNLRPIFKDNAYEYYDFMDPDVAENLGRRFFRGLAAHDPEDDHILSLLIWELKAVEDLRDTESEIKWIYSDDASSIPSVLDEYHKEAESEEVEKTVFEFPSLDEDIISTLSDCDFTIAKTESKDLCVTVDECRSLSLARKSAPLYIQSIEDLDSQEFFQGMMNILFRFDDPSPDDIAYLPKEWYDQTVSCCTRTDGKVTGLFLVHATPSGILVPVMFYAVGPDSRRNLLDMMRFSIHRAAENYSGDTIIRIHRRNNPVLDLSQRLFPDKKGDPAIAGNRKES